MSIAAQQGAERGLVLAIGPRGLGAVSIAAQQGAERGLVLAIGLRGLGAVSIESSLARVIAHAGLKGWKR